MTDYHPDRRSGQREELRQLLAEALQDRSSLRKNGNTWTEYFTKVVTPERLLLVGLFAFQLYGRFERVETDVAAFTARTAEMVKQHDKINERLSSIDVDSDSHHRQLREIQETIAAQTGLIATQTRELRTLAARQAGTATRAEMNAAIEQRLRPPLERMEKALGTKREETR